MWCERAGRIGSNHLAVAWSVVAVFLLTDLIWLPLSRLTFAAANLPRILVAAFTLAALACVPAIVWHRLRRDRSRPAAILRAAADGLSLLTHAAAFTVAMGIVGVTFSYLSTSLAFPLRDAELAAIDRALGFDWGAFLTLTGGHPPLAWILRTAYHSAGPQIVILFLILSFARCELRLHEFLANLAVASLLTAVGMTLIPAEGAYAFYRPAASAFSGYSVDAGMWHHAVLTELRTGAAPVLDFASAQGLVTFPSFHTALAIITWYAVRDRRFLSPAFATLNILVIIATLPEGGHHFVDLVAGGAIAGLAILLVDRAGRLSATSPSDRREMSLKARRT